MTDSTAVLFKLKSGVNKEQLDNFAATARTMVGKIPGTLHAASTITIRALADSDRSSGFPGGAWACGDRAQS